MKETPLRLAEKLLQTRRYAKITQRELWEFIKTGPRGDRSHISHFESGTRVPSLLKLYNYSRFANLLTHLTITIEDFIDDKKDLDLK